MNLKTLRHEKVATRMEESDFFGFWCPECDQKRPTKGRVSRGYKAGFRCACCNEERKQKLWNKANQQADNVKNLHTKEAKDRQVVLMCETLKEAMKGDK